MNGAGWSLYCVLTRLAADHGNIGDYRYFEQLARWDRG